MLDKIRELNEKMLKINNHDFDKCKKYILIKKMLKDDNCFLKMPIKCAHSILRDLEIEEENINTIYLQLIDSKNF